MEQYKLDGHNTTPYKNYLYTSVYAPLGVDNNNIQFSV